MDRRDGKIACTRCVAYKERVAHLNKKDETRGRIKHQNNSKHETKEYGHDRKKSKTRCN